MKLIASLLVVAATLPVGLGMLSAYITDFKSATQFDRHTIANFVSSNLTSEPALMLFVGIGLITIAGVGRRRLTKRSNQFRKRKNLNYTMPPYPDPVPWKKE